MSAVDKDREGDSLLAQKHGGGVSSALEASSAVLVEAKPVRHGAELHKGQFRKGRAIALAICLLFAAVCFIGALGLDKESPDTTTATTAAQTPLTPPPSTAGAVINAAAAPPPPTTELEINIDGEVIVVGGSEHNTGSSGRTTDPVHGNTTKGAPEQHRPADQGHLCSQTIDNLSPGKSAYTLCPKANRQNAQCQAWCKEGFYSKVGGGEANFTCAADGS